MQSPEGTSPTAFSRGVLANVSVFSIVASIATTVLISTLLAQPQQHTNSLHRLKFDLQLQGDHDSSNTGNGNSSSHPQATNNLRLPFRRAAGISELAEVDVTEPMSPMHELHVYPGDNATAPKRVALLVFGLQRSLFLTLPSIQERIFRVLSNAGYEATVFVHQFDSAESDEHSAGVDLDWWSMLKPFNHSVTSQQDLLSSQRSKLQSCVNHGTGWYFLPPQDQLRTVYNLACQLQSVYEVAELWETHYNTHPEEYAAVAYIRPDVHYQSDFPVHLIPELQENEVHVPNWANHMGMNDRFALFHPKSAGLWKGRLDHALQHCLEEPIHSETFARHFAASNRLQVVKLPTDFVFFRVRPNGSIAEPDYLLPGYELAKRELNARQIAVNANQVTLPRKKRKEPN